MKDMPATVDVLVVGAGFGGIYALQRFKEKGYDVIALDQFSGPGGVWYKNRYPGARVDSSSRFYTLMHDEKLYREWEPEQEFSDSAEMRRYFAWLVTALGVEDDIWFDQTVTKAVYDSSTTTWTVENSDGCTISAQHLVLAIGSLNTANVPELPGQDVFEGTVVHTSNWPETEVPGLTGRVGVVGTGSSGIQTITELSSIAADLHVLQRTPQFTLPLGNRAADLEARAEVAEHFEKARERIFAEPKGRPLPDQQYRLAELPPDEQQRMLEEGWNISGSTIIGQFTDLFTDPTANDIFSEFVREKIRTIVKDPETAAMLTPSYGIGAKRVVRDSGFYEAFNRDNVHLVSLENNPIVRLTETGIETANDHIDLDVLIMATGFDAMTGPLFRIDIRGRGGKRLKDEWKSGEQIDSLGGLMVTEFPNLFIIGGAQSPAVHVNVPVLNEYMVEQAIDLIDAAQTSGAAEIEPPRHYTEQWTRLVDEAGQSSITNSVSSWFNGGNIDGKPRSFLTYQGGFGRYQAYFDGLDKSLLLHSFLGRGTKSEEQELSPTSTAG